MTSLLKHFLALLTGNGGARQFKPSTAVTERDVIELESTQGRDLFGEPDRGCRREFFCLDRHTWIWYEEWIDERKQKRSRTTRYEIHDNGIMKVQEGAQYQFLDEKELQNFTIAVRLYYERVMKNVFGRNPHTGALITRS